MSTQGSNHDSAEDSGFKLNEPTKQILGGTRRESIRVPSSENPEVARRLRLNRLLLIHDPDIADENLEQIDEQDQPALRRIAQESVLSGNEPELANAVIDADSIHQESHG